MKAIAVASKLTEEVVARSWDQNSNGLRRLLSPASALIPRQLTPGKRNTGIPLLGKLVNAIASLKRLQHVTLATPASGGSIEN